MIETIEGMLNDVKQGKLTRRQFALSLATLVSGAVAAPGFLTAQETPVGFRAVTLNHVTVRVPDLHRTSKFYQEFFGIEQGEGKAATVDHFDFGIADFNADKVRARLSELHLNFADKTSSESFKFYDPDGFQVQVNGPGYVGHVG